MSKYRRNPSQYEVLRCLLDRNDGSEAIKEDGRNEDYPGNTPWGNPMPSTVLAPKEN